MATGILILSDRMLAFQYKKTTISQTSEKNNNNNKSNLYIPYCEILKIKKVL